MNGDNVGIFGLVREYPEFKYSTKEMMDILGNKLSSGEIMDKLYETKLFWALQRCLVINPEDRYYLII